ncbi:MAG: SpoIID/LytB domain-containing protein, partial [Planctomycetota bacterium]
MASLIAVVVPSVALDAVETITVRDDNGSGGFFTVDFENNYLPNVVLRENGQASFEALKAQAVAARTFAYFKLQGGTFIRNSQADQVYSLGGQQSNPGGRWDQAVRETEGEFLSFNDVLTASFYVAGAIPASATGIATGSDPDPTNTQRFVTYTRANNSVGQFNTGSTLGFVGTPSNPNFPNRGAMSQNGADVLSDNGVHYYDILKFFYGGDIQLGVVNQLPNQTPFAPKTLAGFERNDETFVRPLTFAGQSRNLGTNTGVARSTLNATTLGGTSQQLTFDYDAQADAADGNTDGFFVRHLSGASNTQRLTGLTSGFITTPSADPTGNIVLQTQGTIGFWLLADPTAASADLEVSIAIDDFGSDILANTTEQADFKNVIADGQWHKYEWQLDPIFWSSAFGAAGDGQLDANFTLDSVLFRGFGDAVVYLDDVFYNSTGVIPEPASFLVLLLTGLGVSRRAG